MPGDGDRQELLTSSNFIQIKEMSLTKCNEITMIAAKMPNDKDLPKCSDGSSMLNGCSSEYCIALKMKGSNFVKITDVLRTSMMTTTGSDCEEDLCVAKCQKLTLIAAKHTKWIFMSPYEMNTLCHGHVFVHHIIVSVKLHA